MFNAIRNAAKIGLGAVSLSKENLRKMTDDLVEIGKLSKEEGERLFKEFDKSREDYQKNLSNQVEAIVKKIMDQAGLAPRSELDDLRKKIESLRKRIKELEKQAEEKEAV